VPLLNHVAPGFWQAVRLQLPFLTPFNAGSGFAFSILFFLDFDGQPVELPFRERIERNVKAPAAMPQIHDVPGKHDELLLSAFIIAQRKLLSRKKV